MAAAFSAPGSAQAQAKQFELVVTGSSVDIRAEPSPQGRIVGKAKKGDRFPAMGPSPDKRWIRVRYKGRDAWITSNKSLVNVREVSAGGGGDTDGGSPDGCHKNNHDRRDAETG